MQNSDDRLYRFLPFLITITYFSHFEWIFEPIPIALCAILITGCSLLYFIYKKAFPQHGPLLLVFLLILLFLLIAFWFPSLWNLLYNVMIETYRQFSTLTFYTLPSSIDSKGELLALFMLLSLLFLFVIALFDHLINGCRWLRTSAFLLILLLIPCLLHHVTQPVTIFALSLWIFVLLIQRIPSSLTKFSYAFFVTGLSILLTVTTLIIPKEVLWEHNESIREQTVSKALNQLQTLLNNTKIDQIDLAKAGNRHYAGAIHLQLEGEPQTYYLHTFSGSRYVDNQWKMFSDATYDSRDLDYEAVYESTLLQFDPTNATLLSYQEQPLSSHKVVIEDYRGDNHQALPYYLASLDCAIHPQYDSFSMRDNEQRDYQYQVWDPSSYATYQKDAYTYPNTESDYGKFVNAFYTQLDEKDRDLFSDLQLNNPRYFSLKQASLQEVSEYIQSYLSQNATYTLSPGNLPEGKDFLTYFLTESHQGYCVHYATAATLMLRYYGFPARYVEGYRITAEDFQGNYANIRDFHAHAWVEVYDDILGWIPLEFTQAAPLHEDSSEIDLPEQLPDTPNTPSAQQPNAPSESQDPTTPLTTDKGEKGIPPYAFIFILLLLYLFQLLIRHYFHLHRYERSESNRAVIHLYRTMQKLQTYGLQLPLKAKMLAEKARFSKTGVNKEEWQEMHVLLKDMRRQIKHLPMHKRLLLLFIHALW